MVPMVPKNVIRLYPSRSFITVTNVEASNPPYIEFDNTNQTSSTADTHKFVLLRHKNEQIGVQKVLRNFLQKLTSNLANQ